MGRRLIGRENNRKSNSKHRRGTIRDKLDATTTYARLLRAKTLARGELFEQQIHIFGLFNVH